MPNAEILLRWFDEVWGAARAEHLIDELMAETAQVFGVRGQAPIGRAEFKEVWRTFLQAFPDMRVHVVDTLSVDHRVAFRARVQGSYQGKPFAFEGNGIVEVRNEILVRSHETWDFLGLLVQLGKIDDDAVETLLRECAGE
ncbi:MAG: ester cyclase [Pseudomonadota bacterium]